MLPPRPGCAVAAAAAAWVPPAVPLLGGCLPGSRCRHHVRICESRPGAAGDPQLRPRGVGRYQPAGRVAGAHPWRCLPASLPVAAALPRSGTGTRRGGAAGAGLRGREPRKGAPRGHHGFPTRQERGNALPALPDSAGRAAPTRIEPRGTTRACERFLRPEALETNGRLRILYDFHT
ncbi:hypothetical protein H8959_009270 [Pygathrix nigripes]